MLLLVNAFYMAALRNSQGEVFNFVGAQCVVCDAMAAAYLAKQAVKEARARASSIYPDG